MKTSCQVTPLLSARGPISLSALSTPLCLSDFSSYSPQSSLSPNTLDFLQVFKPPVLSLLLSLCSSFCWKCFHPRCPRGSLFHFLWVFAFQWGLFGHSVIVATLATPDPPSCFIFLHSTYNLLIYNAKGLFVLVIFCLSPLVYELHKSKDFCLFN